MRCMNLIRSQNPRQCPRSVRVPTGLGPQRAWRWCLLMTLRDAHHAQRRGGQISVPNLERLFCRRWARTASRCAPTVGGRRYHTWAQRGRQVLRSDRCGHFSLRGSRDAV